MARKVYPLKPLSWYKSLHDARGRREAGAFLVEGIRAITQIAATSPKSIRELVLVEGDAAPVALGCPVRAITPSQFRAICISANPAGPLAVVDVPPGVPSAALPEKKGGRVLVLEDIQDPGNLGTLVRSAAAFDFLGIVMSDKCADPFSPKAVQASAGSLLVPWMRRTKQYHALVRELLNDGFRCVAADIDGSDKLGAVEAPKVMLIIGNEGSGISPAMLRLAHKTMRIPINGKNAESLNAAVSGTLCMYVLSTLRA